MSPGKSTVAEAPRAAELATLIAAGVVCLTGASAMAGWLLDVPGLVQPDPRRAVTAINEAAALLACGAGVLVARGARNAPLAAVLGAGVMALCAATLAETLLGLELGIDQALVQDHLSRGAPHPGRMAPNTAIALLLAGAALIAERRMPAASGLLGGLCAAIGATALLGYGTGVEPAYGWARWPSMGLATAICLVLLGIATWPLVHAEDSEDALVVWRGPLVAGVACASVTLLFWQALTAREEQLFRRLVEVGARRAEAEIRSGIEDRTAVLTQFAREWEGRLLRLRGSWESDARLLLPQAPGLVALEWIDRSGRNWVYPANARLPAPRVPAPARSGQRLVLSGPIALRDGGTALRALAPLRDGEAQPEGWMSGVYRAAPLFSDILADLDSSFAVEISAGNSLLFRNVAESSQRQRELAVERRLRLPGSLSLGIRVEPSRDLMTGMRSALPPVLLAGGLAMSLLLTLALGLRGVAAARATARDREARAREAAALEVERLNAELEARVLARTAELARSNESLGSFASFLSHELRQPLGALAVWADLLQTKHAGALDDEGRRCVSELRSGVERMGELLEAQLARSRGESAPAEGAPVVDLTALAREVIRELEPELVAIGASVQLELLPAVRGDREELARLIRNLLENAIKYRSPDHPLRIHLRGRGEAGNALLRVEDNGRGFPLAEAEHIFEPAVRLDPESAPGQGIGLALCRQIAASHRGWIRARGTPGGGAVFTVLLPAAEEAEA